MPREPLLLDGDRVIAIGDAPRPATAPAPCGCGERHDLVGVLRSVERWLDGEAQRQAEQRQGDAMRGEMRTLVKRALAGATSQRT
jgi:hypothetical protein